MKEGKRDDNDTAGLRAREGEYKHWTAIIEVGSASTGMGASTDRELAKPHRCIAGVK